MKNIRLIMSSVAAVAALTAASGFALTTPAASAQTAQTHSVNWGDVTIPGQLCEVKGQIHLHNGHATVRHSGFGTALDVLMLAVTHGDLGSWSAGRPPSRSGVTIRAARRTGS